MEAVTAKARKWGNSLGITLPKEVVKREGIKPGMKVQLLVTSNPRNPVRESFGMLKGKIRKSTDDIMREIDRELYND